MILVFSALFQECSYAWFRKLLIQTSYLFIKLDKQVENGFIFNLGLNILAL